MNIDKFENNKNYQFDKIKKDKVLIKILSFIALVFFCFNILFAGLLFFNIKNSLNKKMNINYYNVSVDSESVSTFAVQNARKSSVCVASGGNVFNEESFFEKTASKGSGVILQIDHEEEVVYILTCYHVVSDNPDVLYVLFSSSSIPIMAELVGYTAKYDVAVLKTKFPNNIENCLEISIKNSQLLSVGENVFAIGNSLSGGLSVTSGVVSRLNKEVVIDDTIFREIQTDASINPGNSGGGLFNSIGEFIGLVNAKLSSTTSSSITMMVEGMAFAIPSNLSFSIANCIIKNQGFPTYVDFGLSLKNLENYISSVNIEDNIIDEYEVRVESISKNSIFNNILKVDDVILSFKYFDLFGNINEVQMTNKYCLEDISFNILDNSELELKIIRPLFNDEITEVVTINRKIIQK